MLHGDDHPPPEAARTGKAGVAHHFQLLKELDLPSHLFPDVDAFL